MNHVTLIGHLGRAVELRELGGGKVVGKTIVAVNRMRKGQRAGTDWIPIVLWDAQARNAAQYLQRGSRVGIDGRIHGDFVPRKASDGGEPGRPRLLVEVVVERITYLSAPRAAERGSGDGPADAEGPAPEGASRRGGR